MNKFLKALLITAIFPLMILAGECDVPCHQGKTETPSKTQIYKESCIKKIAEFIKNKSLKITDVMLFFEDDQIIIIDMKTNEIRFVFDSWTL